MKLASHMLEKYGTARQWRATHRARVKAALKALDAAWNGSAFGPSREFDDLDAARQSLRNYVDAVSAKNWRRT